MEVVSLTCPKCGGSVNSPAGESICYCAFCGTQLIVDDGSRTVTYRVVDEARIHEADVRESIETKRITAEDAAREREGIDSAKKRGVRFGRPKIEKPECFEKVLNEFNEGLFRRRESAERLGISISTFDRWRKS